MTITVVVGCADQGLAYELRSRLTEIADIDVAYVGETTTELTAAVLRLEPQVVLLHDRLGPGDIADVMRDLSLRRPATAHLVITGDTEPETYAAAMAAGARGLLAYPFAFEEVQARLADAVEWSATMQRLISDRSGVEAADSGRAVVVTLTGAKGGVGTTTVALHLALDVVREVPGHKVLLLDLDLEKGDVGWLLDARHRVSIADLAKVADDLSPRTVLDAVFPHDSGLQLLLTPLDVREVEDVTPQAVRRILSLLRQQYDLVVVDAGSHVTPVQAAAVEAADEVVVVTTPDVLALRTLRRTLQSWEDLGVRKPEAARVLLNKVSRADEVQPDTVRRLAQAPIVSVALPAMFRKLEQAVNNRDPLLVREQAWWQALRAAGREIGIVRVPARQDLAAQLIESGRGGKRARRRGLRRSSGGAVEAQAPGAARLPAGEAGSITVETVGVLPAVLLVVALLWQVVLVGATFVWTGHAASTAAQAVSVGDDPFPPAVDRLPSAMRGGAQVSSPPGHGGSRVVRVSVPVPLFAPGLIEAPWRITIERRVIRERDPSEGV
jgi:pilus assembly protein CpaE